MKTPEELKELKEEVEALNKKLAELSGEDFKAVAGGNSPCSGCPHSLHCDDTYETCPRWRDL